MKCVPQELRHFKNWIASHIWFTIKCCHLSVRCNSLHHGLCDGEFIY